jgi:hypothetical protein
MTNVTETNDDPTTSKPNASHFAIDDAVAPVCSDEDWGPENSADDSDDEPDFKIFHPSAKRIPFSLSVSPSSPPSRKGARQSKRNRWFEEEEEEEEEGKRR